MRRRKSRARRLVPYTMVGLVGLLVLAQIALSLFFDADAYRRQIEQIAANALGLEIKLRGRLSLELFPGLHVAVRDVQIRNRGSDIVSLKHASIGIELFPLLRREVHIGAMRFTRPRIHIERGRDGRYNFSTPGQAKNGTLPAFDVGRISLVNASLRYADNASGDGFEARGCNFETRRLRYPGGPTAGWVKKLALAARLACREIRRGNLAVADLKSSITGNRGVLDFNPIAMRLLGGRGSGRLRLDLSRAESVVELSYALTRFRVEELFKLMPAKLAARGALDLSANLSFRGKREYEIRRSAAGAVSIRGTDLTLVGTDLDKGLARYESSQTFNLLDAGAIFLAGPIGLVATKGYNFASIARAASGNTRIGALVSDWKVTGSVARAQDVALATSVNRIALNGRLDFVNERFDDITIAVVDTEGCATLRQAIRGPFRSPTLDKPGVLASLAGPVVKLFTKIGRCKPFYTGSVAPPKRGGS